MAKAAGGASEKIKQTRNKVGRPVSPMRKKLQEALLGLSDDYIAALEELRDDDNEAFVREYNKALPYVMPRLQTTKIETDAPKGFKITITDAGSQPDKK